MIYRIAVDGELELVNIRNTQIYKGQVKTNDQLLLPFKQGIGKQYDVSGQSQYWLQDYKDGKDLMQFRGGTKYSGT